jgi:hypothetical protein
MLIDLADDDPPEFHLHGHDNNLRLRFPDSREPRTMGPQDRSGLILHSPSYTGNRNPNVRSSSERS